MLSPSLRLEPGEVRAWYASTTGLLSAKRVETGLRWLTASERNRYERFYLDEDRQMFLLGRMLARALVGATLGISPTEWTWRDGQHGRPEIASPATSLRFNLAHSAGLVLCALARGREVGVDVEDLRRRPVDRDVVRRYCTPAEIADIQAHGDRWHDRFLRYWTLKEAYLKARGLGISMPLAEIGFTPEADRTRILFLGSLAGTDDRWAFFMGQPTDRHVVALAASTEDGAKPTCEFRPVPSDLLA